MLPVSLLVTKGWGPRVNFHTCEMWNVSTGAGPPTLSIATGRSRCYIHSSKVDCAPAQSPNPGAPNKQVVEYFPYPLVADNYLNASATALIIFGVDWRSKGRTVSINKLPFQDWGNLRGEGQHCQLKGLEAWRDVWVRITDQCTLMSWMREAKSQCTPVQAVPEKQMELSEGLTLDHCWLQHSRCNSLLLHRILQDLWHPPFIPGCCISWYKGCSKTSSFSLC